MSNNTAALIRARIENRLTAATLIKAVVHGHTTNYSQGSPYAKIWVQGLDLELIENDKTQKRTWRYAIEIVQDSQAKDRALAEANFQDAIEQVLGLLRADWTLNDNCEISMAESVAVVFQDAGTGVQISAIIGLNVTTYVDA